MNEALKAAIQAKLNQKQLTEAVITKAATDGLPENQVEAIVSTSSIDRHGEILNISGLDTAAYEKNGVVLWAHDYEGLPIAKLVSLTKTTDGLLKAVFEFAVDIYPFAKTVYEMIKGGYLSAVSIGFIPKDYEWNNAAEAIIWTKSEMLEFSVVPVPANPEALITAKGLNLTKDQWAEYTDWIIKNLGNALTTKEESLVVQKEVDPIGLYIDLLQKAVSGMGDIIAAQDTESGAEVQPAVRTRKIVKRLITIRKAAHLTDKISEYLITAVNDQLSKA